MSINKKIFLAIALAAVTLVLFWAQNRFLINHNPPALQKRNFTEDLLGEREIKLKPEPIEIILVGDIMLSRNVAEAINKAGDPELPFRHVSDFLKSADFAFGNLESPFSGSDKFAPSPSLVFNAPKKNVLGLVENNFKILSLANNHTLDQKLEGLIHTKTFLDENGIKTVGAGKNQAEAWQAQVIEVKGKRIGFLAASYASYNDGGKTRNEYVARMEDLDNLKSEILNLKSYADFIIVAMHAGTEYTHKPREEQVDFARAAVDFGADVVGGHHPHWIQPIEVYRPTLLPSPSNGEGGPPAGGTGEVEQKPIGLIFYSLGNFIFDQEWSQKTKEGLATRLTIDQEQLTKAELIPIIIENYCCARLADPQESARILSGINATSTINFQP